MMGVVFDVADEVVKLTTIGGRPGTAASTAWYARPARPDRVPKDRAGLTTTRAGSAGGGDGDPTLPLDRGL
jgi:hypothetical protein